MSLHFIQILLWAVIQITNQQEIVSLENMTLDKLSAIGRLSILPNWPIFGRKHQFWSENESILGRNCKPKKMTKHKCLNFYRS